MQKRSLFSRIFGSDKPVDPPDTSTTFKILDDTKAIFTRYNGDFKKDADVLACVDAIARNGAKMHPRHIRNFGGKMENVKSDLYKLLAKQPNELQNAFKFYYQVIAELELNNNSIIYISKDENLKVKGLYPLKFDSCEFYEYQKQLWVKFKFGRSKAQFVPYSSCIHLTRGDSKDGIFGGTVEPLKQVLSMKHILDEGIINAIKTTQAIRGIIKSTKAILKQEDVEKMREQFVDAFMKNGDKYGIGALDATTEFTPVDVKPTIATAEQMKNIDEKVLKYFGINENILTSSYNENQWNAFYESVIEPIGIQMSLEFSNKLFTPTEKAFGNEIIFESNRLQYASNSTKLNLIRFASNIMTINELREVLNLAPAENGDVFMIDQNHEVNDDVSEIDSNEDEGGEEDEGN